MKVALLGPEGTYTHQAAGRYFDGLEPEFCSTVTEVFESDLVGFVPVENSIGGGVRDTIDLFREREREITGEHVERIEHCLVSVEDSVEDVETVVSHPQALAQCSGFLENLDVETREASSTAAAARDLEAGEAALASEKAAEIYGLSLLERGVQDSDSRTRFLVLDGAGSQSEKTSLILEPGEDRPGLLHSMLGCFAGHGINLSHIESRPAGELGEYFFYVEAEEPAGSESFRNSVKCLETYSDVEVLGSYS